MGRNVVGNSGTAGAIAALLLTAIVLLACGESPAPPSAGVEAVAPAPGVEGAPASRLYGKHCQACHGADGTGSGPLAVFLLPRPRYETWRSTRGNKEIF